MFSSNMPPPAAPPTISSGPPLLKRIASFTRRRSRDGSMELSAQLPLVEQRLTEKTNLIDDLKKIVPLDVEAPGIIALGLQGSGKSTILEALTGVPIPRSAANAVGGGYGAAALPRRALQIKICSDPTVSKYVVVRKGQ